MITIQIVTHNSANVIRDCITSLFEHVGIETGFEIVVVDNASTDGTTGIMNELMELHKNIRFLQNTENVGFGRGHNQAAKVAAGTLFILNPDVTFTSPDIIAALEKLKKVESIVGFGFTYPSGSLQHTIGRDPTVWRIFADRIPFVQKYAGIKIRPAS